MVITVDKLSDAPLYLQLRDAVIAGIASGELRPGDALPSVRSLAEDLGINPTPPPAWTRPRSKRPLPSSPPSSRRPAAPGTHFSRPPNAPHGTWTRERTCRLTS